MFEPFQKFITKAASRHGIQKEMTAATVCHNFTTLIPQLFDPALSPETHIRAGHYKNSTLTIYVKTPAWGQEIATRKDKIIEEMNARAGQKIIRDLKTLLDNEFSP